MVGGGLKAPPCPEPSTCVFSPAFTALVLQVRREDLLTYLRAKQAEGYVLVGAEQTAQSISLEEFTFPDRTVVVLG